MDDAQAVNKEFIETYLEIARSKATGTLKVFSSEQAKQVLFVDGLVSEVDTCRGDTVLEAALLHTQQFSERDLKKAQKTASRGQKTLGAALLELDVIEEESVQENLREQIAAEICEVFEWTLEGVEFVEHESDERLEDFFCELGEYYEIYTDAEELCIEAARLRQDWGLVEEHFGILHDVFYATPASMHYFNASDTHPYEHAVISAVDSVRDAGEVIVICRVEPYAGLNTIRKMGLCGELDLIDPVQMYQLGLERAEAKDLEKAYRLFRRAQERGLDDFDLQLRLAQILETLGRQIEAIGRYIQFAEKCREQGRLEEAVRTFRRITKIDPDRLDVRKELLELLIQLNRVEETRAEAIESAEKLAALGEAKTALELLGRVRDRFPGDLQLQEALIQFAGKVGDPERMEAERKRLDEEFDLSENVEAALETYQHMFCEGQDRTDVRLKLVELHRQSGQLDKALEHAHGLLNLSKKRRIRDEALLLKLHQTVRELGPTDFRSNLWLADYHLRRQETQPALEVLTTWVHVLVENDPENHEIATAYQKLLSLDDRLEHRWGLVDALETLGREKEAHRELRTIAELAAEQDDIAQAERAIDRILKTSPFSLEAHAARVKLAHPDDVNAGNPHARDATWLAVLKPDIETALAMSARLPKDSSLDAVLLYRVGLLAKECGAREKAVAHFLEAAQLHAAQRNFGLGEEAVAAVITIDPRHQEAHSILAQLQAPTVATSQEAPTAVAESGVDEAATPAGTAVETATAPVEVVEATATAPVEPVVKTATASIQPSAETINARLPNGLPVGEPFQGTPAVKTTVSNITARLRRLKSGGNESQGRGKVVKAASAAERLRAMKAGAQGGGGTVATKSAALQSAASLLKALSSEADTASSSRARDATAEAVAPAPQAGTTPSTDGENAADLAANATPKPEGGDGGGPLLTKKAALGGAAGRLAALRKGNDAGTHEATPSTDGENAADLATNATPKPEGGDGGGEVMTKKATLGGAASRLAKLREQAKSEA